MSFDEIPLELKEYIFTYVTPNEWITTVKVSNEWMDLTLGSIKKVESCHLLILDHVAEIINQLRDTNYTWVSLLTLMPRLEHLECIENTEAFWKEISPICHQLKVLDCKPREVESFDWNKLNISFANLVELHCEATSARDVLKSLKITLNNLTNYLGDLRDDGIHERAAFLLKIFESAPKLQKITLKSLKIDAEWKNKIPKSVKHISLNDVLFLDEQQCSMNNLCEDSSHLETFSACESYFHTRRTNFSHFFDVNWNSYTISNFFDAPRLNKLVLSHPKASDILQNAFTKCPNLETVCIEGESALHISARWRKGIPANVKSFKASAMSIENNVGPDFSFDWLFQNYSALQSLEVKFVDMIGVDPQKFHSTKNLRKLHLDNDKPPRASEPNDPFSTICNRMIRGSYLVDVEIWRMTITESWRHIFPPTVRRLKMNKFSLSTEAKNVFSPQFICENPSNLELLSLQYFKYKGVLPMNLKAFNGMSKLEVLHSTNLGALGLQSIFLHCFALEELSISTLKSDDLRTIPGNWVLPSLRKLCVEEPVDQPALLLQHFPKMGKVDITITPKKNSWLEVMNCLQGVGKATINVEKPSFDLLRTMSENINDTEFKFLCLYVENDRRVSYSFHLTNSLLDACSELNRFYVDLHHRVLWIKNYPTSPLLREINIPSNMHQLSQVYRMINSRRQSGAWNV